MCHSFPHQPEEKSTHFAHLFENSGNKDSTERYRDELRATHSNMGCRTHLKVSKGQTNDGNKRLLLETEIKMALTTYD